MMNQISRVPRCLAGVVLLASLAACVTPPEQVEQPAKPVVTPEPKPVVPSPAPTPVPPPQPVPQINEASVLKDGIAAYNNGEYAVAIKRLSGPEIWGSEGTKTGQLQALKYMAFSYCVTSRQVLCRQQFEKALKLDPQFDLAPGEKGHPLWGPVFARVQKAAQKARAKAGSRP